MNGPNLTDNKNHRYSNHHVQQFGSFRRTDIKLNYVTF